MTRAQNAHGWSDVLVMLATYRLQETVVVASTPYLASDLGLPGGWAFPSPFPPVPTAITFRWDQAANASRAMVNSQGRPRVLFSVPVTHMPPGDIVEEWGHLAVRMVSPCTPKDREARQRTDLGQMGLITK